MKPFPPALRPWLVAVVMATCELGTAGPVATDVEVAHNKHRAAVGVGPLTYSAPLAASAQLWADRLQADRQCGLQHSTTPHGENLYAIKSFGGPTPSASADEVVGSWASEKKDYDLASNSCKPNAVCGHYTQVVWKNSQSVGCGVAACTDGRSASQVWVCQYDPPGNYVNQRPY